MNDWASAVLIDGFPKHNMTYYIQFITDPTIVTKKSDYGGKYKQAQISLQFFAIDKYGKFHYMDWENITVQPCVLSDLTAFGPDLLSNLLEVKGVTHKKHVDLEFITCHDYIDPNAVDALITQPNPPTQSPGSEQEGPPKPAPLNTVNTSNDKLDGSERGQPQAGEVTVFKSPEPTDPAPAACSHKHALALGEAYCKDCGERVG